MINNFISRFNLLRSLFSFESRVDIDGSVEILPFCFEQKDGDSDISAFQRSIMPTDSDDTIAQNRKFIYTIFKPQNCRTDRAIVLLHGLNERSWHKYLPWAEYLARETNKCVILFPIAFHMNRTPTDWYDPRKVASLVDSRRADNIHNTTFANVTISRRIASQPLRFYASALETIYNLRQLADEIRTGTHPAFEVNTTLDFFAYSIGASVAQTLFASDSEDRFNTSRLFMFCGGALLETMNGCQKDIMDSGACHDMTDYYSKIFVDETHLPEIFRHDNIEQACKMIIRSDKFCNSRNSFFEQISDRIRAITLKQDSVMPTSGVYAALGSVAERVVTELDFQFSYSHQLPFPTCGNADPAVVNSAFCAVFDRASDFLK